MDPIGMFCLSAIVFPSLPLPLFASAAVESCPSLRKPLIGWVWANVAVGSVMGLLLVATSFPPLVAAGIASVAFVLCGTQMFRRVALLNGAAT